MYLHNIKIHGFKSFSKKTTLEFNGGLTCVVGPNGCGKSNIVDAVRWVLGEQKSSVLRSEKMENVIFSGSNTAKQLGMAEVSLLIENTRSVLPTEFSEILITRRLFRSGDSEYLINKAPCRLKDINDLFLDTGIGPDSYSVIELKMVESILSTKTDERLRLFEEAAGINKYKQRRSAAFRKLESTELDLSRVNDLLSEVERNKNALKRQVNKAERYQKLTHEIEEFEIRAASLELFDLNKKLNPMKDRLNLESDSLQKNRSDLSKVEAEVEKTKTILLGMEEKLSKLQNELMSVTDNLHQKENEVITCKERIKASKEKIQRYEEESVGLKQRIETLGRRIEEGEPQLGILAEKADGLRIKHDQKARELEEFEKILGRRRLELNEARMALINLMNGINEKEKERHSLETQLLHLEGREEQLAGEIERLSKTDTTLSRERNLWIEKESEFSAKREAAVQELRLRKDDLVTMEDAIANLKEQSVQINSRLEALTQKETFLRSLIESHEGYPGGVRHIMQNIDALPGVLGTIGDLLSVPEPYRRAVEAVIGEQANYVVVESEARAHAAIDALRHQKAGQVTFVMLDRLAGFAEAKADQFQHEKILAQGRDLAGADKKLNPLLAFLFDSVVIVENGHELSTVVNDLGKSHAIRSIATVDGEVRTRDGLYRSEGFEQGEVITSVSRQEQLQEALAQIKQLQIQQQDLDQDLKQHRDARESLRSGLADLEQKFEKTEDAYQQSRIHSAQRQTAQSNLRTSLDAAQAELKGVRDTIAEVSEKLDRMNPELEEKARGRSQQEEQIELLQEKLAGFEAQRNEQANEVHDVNVALVKTTSDHSNFAAELDRMKRNLTEFKNTIVTRGKEITEAQNDIEHYQKEIAQSVETLEDLRISRDNLLQKQAAQKQEYQQLQHSVGDHEVQLKQARESGESFADILQSLRLEISEAEMRIENLRGNIREKYTVEITPIATENPDELSTLRTALEHNKDRLRLIGPVNLLALEEFKKESERFEFMQKQKEDLIEAKQTLRETIDLINNTASDKFQAVFEQIRENFRENFSAFFEGGEGDLTISFADSDPLSAQIVILARPSGKRLGAIELLSAGEKALTAIALLFSIYQVKPSPFCILDEVDAPLDDLNVRRFLRVLRKFSEHTQFIVVTHNKITMEAADYIYGVTMEQEGVSKIVSVELGKEEMVEP